MANWTAIPRVPAFQPSFSPEPSELPYPSPPHDQDFPAAVPRAGFWKRSVANLVDSSVLVVPTLFARLVQGFVVGEGREASRARA